jgi:hypothetical protein
LRIRFSIFQQNGGPIFFHWEFELSQYFLAKFALQGRKTENMLRIMFDHELYDPVTEVADAIEE